MKARNARLNSNGGWCVKNIENYVDKKTKYNLPSEYLGMYKYRWICSIYYTTPSNAWEIIA